ncbi:hypothetical protein IHV25_02275 [Phaeovibrio sulfidiphilus]|uniref:Uncharacterized protein n=1 Tax=Phaeovibrio sulfidiphilus TaxID=1220600 RepID=A0A8J6YU60_9PROT|nr:hypothetical protein [Phaeovibrio sulfidiphilus]MBE1236479.1 hypothetical protein [Phaeovibrio sulfidiphilus]
MLFWLVAFLGLLFVALLLARRRNARPAPRRPAAPAPGPRVTHLREVRLSPLARSGNPLVAAAAVSLALLQDGPQSSDSLRASVETDILARLYPDVSPSVMGEALDVVREMGFDRIAIVDEAATLFNGCLTPAEKAEFLSLLEEAARREPDTHNRSYFLGRLRKALGVPAP